MTASQGEITVTILGSGTCVPSLRRSSCSVLMAIAEQKLLFDSGVGTMRRLLEAETTIFEISFVFYSHFHPDHTAEFVPFLFANKYPDGTKRRMPVTVVAGRGFLDFFDKLKQAYGNWIKLAPGLLNILELDNKAYDTRKFEGFTLESLPVAHNDESLAYKITTLGGVSVVYSGDTGFSENLIVLSENADLLICESALPNGFNVDGHLTPSLAGEIATRAKVRKLVLTHFYPECDQVDMEKQCRQTYAGPLLLAEDLMTIAL